MIMGCEKRVIVVKDTGSDIFDEAYFIVSKNAADTGHNDFLFEANRIIASKSVERLKRRKRLFSFLLVPICFLSGVAFTLFSVLIFA